MDRLTRTEIARFRKCPVKCPKLNRRICSLADFFNVLSGAMDKTGSFWFRGHAKVEWSLTPLALRYKKQPERERALRLIAEFKRVAEIKIRRPPHPNQQLMWTQIARHYGLPTRLLDWTESAAVALYFACEHPESDGLVFVLNPIHLNRLSYPTTPRILDAHSDEQLIGRYLRLGGRQSRTGRNPIAINPVWNSERLMVQRGVFTLHGTRFSLDDSHIPSLVVLPILNQSKPGLHAELQSVGIDEMTIFPELEHACRHLKRKTGLE